MPKNNNNERLRKNKAKKQKKFLEVETNAKDNNELMQKRAH
jgi:hypothetical protein